MKILHLCKIQPCKDGAFERLISELSLSAQSQGYEYKLALSGAPSGAARAMLLDTCGHWHVLPVWGVPGVCAWIRTVRDAVAWIRLERPSVVGIHFGNESTAIALRVLVRLFGCRCAWVWEQDQQMCEPVGVKRFINWQRLLAVFGFFFIAMYEGGKASMVARGVPEKAISVVFNGVRDYRGPKVNLRELLGIDADIVVTMVSFLIDRKRVDVAIRAFDQAVLRSSSSSSCLVIIGDGPNRSALEKMAANCSSDIMFLGLRDDVRAILSASDIFLHASRAETCTYAVSEAMCAEVPVVTTDCGASSEQIENTVSGFVHPVGDDVALADSLTTLMDDSVLRCRMGRVARSRWMKSYSLDQAARGYISVYEEARSHFESC